MKTTLKLKTPLWTGDIDSKSNSLQSTGLMGSLRWWTEVILRGMDKFVCDPIGDNRCPEEKNKNNQQTKTTKYYCPACLILGATGMRRVFRLEISGGERVFNGGTINIRPDGRRRGWYLGSGLMGQIDLRIIAIDRDFDENLLLIPLIIASKWGALGAKTQHGYGVVEFEQKKDLKIGDFKDTLKRILLPERLKSLNIEERKNGNNELPNLKEMFFAKVQFKVQDNDWWKGVDGIKEDNIGNYRGYTNDPRMKAWVNSGSVPIAPAVKNWLRFGYGKSLWQSGNQNNDKRIENWLFGTTERICSDCYNKVKKDTRNPQNFWCSNCRKSLKKDETYERMSSKINISCAYKIDSNLWEFRIWGWIPKNKLPDGFYREDFLKNLKQSLSGDGSVKFPWDNLLGKKTNNYKLTVWREFNTSRDTLKKDENNFENYLQSLINGEEESLE